MPLPAFRAAAIATVLAAGCATTPSSPTPDTLSAAFPSKSYILLGEVHDNPRASCSASLH